MDWNRLATQMIREMIRQFLRCPGEFLSFGKLAFRIRGSNKDILHAIAEQRPDLFVITKDDRAVKLHTEVVGMIVREQTDVPPAQLEIPARKIQKPHERKRCIHFSEEELLDDLQRCSLPPEALTRNCCWREICRLRGQHLRLVTPESWSEICRVRGYLLARQNPRGF